MFSIAYNLASAWRQRPAPAGRTGRWQSHQTDLSDLVSDLTTVPSLDSQLRLQHLDIDTMLDPEDRATIETSLSDVRAARVTELSRRVEERAPGFTLCDANHIPVSLADALHHGPAIVTFYMGGWSPYCALALRAMQDWIDDFHLHDARIVAVSPDTPEQARATAQKHELGFSLLSDPLNRVARDFGITVPFDADVARIYRKLGFEAPLASEGADLYLPIPATFVVDQRRSIRWAFVNPDYRRRAEPGDIAGALASL